MRGAAEQPAQRVGIAREAVLRVIAEHGGERRAFVLAGAGGAGARLPGIDRFGFGADIAAQSGADGGRSFFFWDNPSCLNRVRAFSPIWRWLWRP